MLKSVMEPLITAQKLLEGEMYIMVILFVSYISDLRDELNHASDHLQLPAPPHDPVRIAVMKAVIPCVEALVEDGKRSPRVQGRDEKTAAGIPAEAGFSDCPGSPHEVVVRDRGTRAQKGMEIFSQRAAEIVTAKHRGRAGATASSPTSRL